MADTGRTISPTYSSYTYDSPSKLKRLLHRHRHAQILRPLTITWNTKIVDFDAGDGRLFRVLIDQYGADPGKLVAFDPEPVMIDGFRTLVPEARIVGNSREISTPLPGNEPDYIFCCEVLEHLMDPQIETALAELKRLAGPQTTFVIAVPIEIGPAGLLKNLFRRFN